jgi:hypothetical protein
LPLCGCICTGTCISAGVRWSFLSRSTRTDVRVAWIMDDCTTFRREKGGEKQVAACMSCKGNNRLVP